MSGGRKIDIAKVPPSRARATAAAKRGECGDEELESPLRWPPGRCRAGGWRSRGSRRGYVPSRRWSRPRGRLVRYFHGKGTLAPPVGIRSASSQSGRTRSEIHGLQVLGPQPVVEAGVSG